MESTGGVEGLFDRSDHAPLNGQRFARDTRPGRGLVPAASEQAGDVAHVDAITFRAEADARQFRFELFEDASDDDRFDGADVIDESLTVGSVGPGTGEVGLPQPEVSDLIIVRKRV